MYNYAMYNEQGLSLQELWNFKLFIRIAIYVEMLLHMYKQTEKRTTILLRAYTMLIKLMS
jgi:hypothetical protein